MVSVSSQCCPVMATVGGPTEWRENHRQLCSRSESEVRLSARCREEAAWLCENTSLQTLNNQQDVRFRIKEKLTTTTRWRQELQEERDLNTKQTESLKKNLSKLRRTLIKSEEPLKVTTECQHYRQSRVGVDKISDQVEEHLSKETDCIREYQQRMKLLIEMMIKQMEANKMAQKTLNTDMRNKKISISIDNICEQLSGKSAELESHSRIQNILVNKSVPQSWNRDSQNNIQLSRNSRFASQQLERDASNLIRRAENSIKTNWADTNNAFRERISSSQAAQTKISQRLQEVSKELSAARKELRRLKSCQHDTLVPSKMIQTRLERRSHRPHNEACTDSPHIRLLKESQQLEENKELLNQKTKETEDIISNLDMVRASLERDVRVKRISLNIDKNKCLPLRAIFKFDISAKINKK